MKRYLSLTRAAALANLTPEQLAALCVARRLDARRLDDDWFVAETELIDTLSLLERNILLAEIEDLLRAEQQREKLEATARAAKSLQQVTAVIFSALFILFGLAMFKSYLMTPRGQQLAQIIELSPTLEILQNKITANFQSLLLP